MTAHEINNPLASVMTYARLVARRLRADPTLTDQDRDRLLDHLGRIEAETRRCGDIVKSMLSLSRRTPVQAPVDLSEVVDRAVHLVQHGLDLEQVNLTVESPGAGGLTLVGSADQLQQMLVALLVNAVEAMEGRGRLRVAVAPAGDAAVVIEVEDSGPGIPPEIRSEIFEPFYSTKEGEKGVGLGLAVVHGIVERHGGTIEVEAGAAGGTTFRITLPLQPPAVDRS
jgi:two-component system NtrC family sensor kinase